MPAPGPTCWPKGSAPVPAAPTAPGSTPRLLALHVGHDRHPEGRDAPARQHRPGLRDLRPPGAGHHPGRPVLLRGEAVFRVRHRELAVLPVLGRRHRGPDPARATPAGAAARLARGPPVAVLRRRPPSSPRCSPRTLPPRPSPRCGWRHRRARPCPPRSTGGSPAATGRHHRRAGSTEALHIFISNQPGAVRPGTSGTVVPGYEARLVDDHDEPVADGHPGLAARARRLDRDRVLVPDRHHPAGVRRASGCGPATPTSARRTASTPAWAAPTT